MDSSRLARHLSARVVGKEEKTMRSKFLVLFMNFLFVLLLGCQKSEVQLLERKAQESLASTDWQSKKQGMDIVLRIKDKVKVSDKTVQLMLKALEQENQRKKDFKKQPKLERKTISQIEADFDKQYPRQEYGDYLVSLATLLAEAKPKGSLPIIFEFLVDTNYVVSPVLPTVFGDSGLAFLIKKASEGSVEEQKQAIQTLSLWVNPPQEAEDWDPTIIPKLTQEQKHQIFPILMKALENADSYVVYCVTASLEAFLGEPNVREKLMEISLHSSYQNVRDEAKRILKKEKNQ